MHFSEKSKIKNHTKQLKSNALITKMRGLTSRLIKMAKSIIFKPIVYHINKS
tara:strand:+ start:106 stop:261 length:156 start_codon:yes stop_codon:yes gene_type:complete